ncbi:MAG: GNAT family N-acetyltransferase [Cyclobacteriaceae bacterium]|nr:GNAT family N-acetyltransferase [Cyclobacteriaceae bacterium]
MKTLHTKRLSLRLITESDLEEIHLLQSIPEVDKYNTLGIPKDFEETKKVMAPLLAANQKEEIDYFTFAIEQKLDNEFVGLIALVLNGKKYNGAEVWFKLYPKFWGKGYATESLNKILDFGFDELKLHRIGAGCAVDNKASARVLEKVGMQYEGRQRKILPLKSGWSDNFEYAILESDERPKL